MVASQKERHRQDGPLKTVCPIFLSQRGPALGDEGIAEGGYRKTLVLTTRGKEHLPNLYAKRVNRAAGTSSCRTPDTMLF